MQIKRKIAYIVPWILLYSLNFNCIFDSYQTRSQSCFLWTSGKTCGTATSATSNVDWKEIEGYRTTAEKQTLSLFMYKVIVHHNNSISKKNCYFFDFKFHIYPMINSTLLIIPYFNSWKIIYFERLKPYQHKSANIN